MYRVSIRNMVTGTWRTTTETSLAKAVQLVWGIRSENKIVDLACNRIISERIQYKFIGIDEQWNNKRVQHTQRSLVARWMKQFQNHGNIKTKYVCDQYRMILRLSDRAIRTEHIMVAIEQLHSAGAR